LARLGIDYRNPKGLPRVASVEKQAEFITISKRLLNELEANLAADFPPLSDCKQSPAGHGMMCDRTTGRKSFRPGKGGMGNVSRAAEGHRLHAFR
jgi:hypothetical protein